MSMYLRWLAGEGAKKDIMSSVTALLDSMSAIYKTSRFVTASDAMPGVENVHVHTGASKKFL